MTDIREGDPSSLKDAALRLGALNWAAFFEQLRRVAERAGEDETVRVVSGILAQERAAASRLAGAFDEAVGASLASVGVAAV